MFVLTKVSDLIRIEPESFGKVADKAIEDEINVKYSNKVIHNVGLCVCLFDIESIDDGLTRPGDGCVYVKIFRPFVGEIIVGWISSCTEQGLDIKMGFFDDIHIPKSLMFDDCVFDSTEKAWIWKSPGYDLYFDINEKIRFRVEQEFFSEQHPVGPNNGPLENESAQNVIAPYSILGSCQTDGMGVVTWWD